MNLAINNAIVVARQQGRKPDGAAAGATATVLAFVFPKEEQAIGRPNHPSYPSNHACVSGAMGLVLDGHFPDQGGRFFAMGRQASESRVYAGIHYRFDLDDGYAIAHKLSAKALQTGIPLDRPFTPLGR